MATIGESGALFFCITRKTIDQIKNHKRLLNIVSRGGSLVFAWMSMTGHENPFYEYFDEILKICKEYDVTLSLGDACRPGCLADATDVCQIEELVRLGELAKRAKQYGVQAMIEGPGHVPLHQIQMNMEIKILSLLCHQRKKLLNLSKYSLIIPVRLYAIIPKGLTVQR